MTAPCDSLEEAADLGSVGELCIALAHRWEPENAFVILTAYFDESGTHGGPMACVAGFMGTARGWRNFEKRTAKLFRRYRVNIFHTIDVRRTHEDFTGWSVDRKIKFLDEFQHIVNQTMEVGVACFLKYEDYDYYTKLPWPKGTRKDSMYGILFRGALSAVVDAVVRMGESGKQAAEPRLYAVVEDGHKNAEDLVRIYKFFEGRFGHTGRALAGLTFKSKKECLPLAAADLFAYTSLGHEVGQKPIGTPRQPLKSEASYRGNAYRIMIERESLDALREQAIMIASERRSSSGRPS